MRRLLPELDYIKVTNYIVAGLIEYFVEVGRKTGIIGLSGGLDSSVVAYLTVKALGVDRVRLYIMPSSTTPGRDIEDAMSIIERLKVLPGNFRVINIDGVVRAFEDALGEMGRVERGNIMSRTRMTILYHEAAVNDGLVVGTGDKSEILIGYFTKYGDGGADILPIAGLYKTYVRRLAEHLGVPEKIRSKPSSPALWPGHTAEGELGVDYEIIDTALYLCFEEGLGAEEVHRVSGIPLGTIMNITERIRKTEHKRNLPKTLPINYREMVAPSGEEVIHR
ncbi:MAG: NAD+ synthase [Thermoproteota archaeon]